MSDYIYLHVLAEGQAEREFAQKTLAPYFPSAKIMVDSRCVPTSKKKHKKGGGDSYLKIKNDLTRWIAEEKGRRPYFTTMLDLYALPTDFPGFEASLNIADPYKRVAFLEQAFLKDIDYRKFILYIQLHEFEALLFANPEILLSEYPNAAKQVEKLKEIVANYDGNPEAINTGNTTAPSKRIISLIPEYEYGKVSMGAVLAGKEGVASLQQRCQHFSDWINKIQSLTNQSG
jgi:hypothetical protein